MLGEGKKFQHYRVKQFELPDIIHLKDLELINERHFIEFFLRNDWVQRTVGIRCRSSNGLFPDLKAEIYDMQRTKIRVEAEYHAENYAQHKHEFGGCDLILSFIRKPHTKVMRGCPVWSFYESNSKDDTLKLCLYDDINYDFSTHHIEDYEDSPINTSINHHIESY